MPNPMKIKSNLEPKSHFSDFHMSGQIMQDALGKHLLGLAPYGMTDVGEVLESYCQLPDTSEEAWIDVWGKLAEKLEKQADEKLKYGHRVSAGELYLRSSTYYRAALICFANPEDKRVMTYTQKAMVNYDKSITLQNYPGKAIKIPYEDTTLPGHLYISPVAAEKAPIMILIPGRDTWADDTRWLFDSLVKRGIHCLTFDGPGQASVLRLQNIPSRPDFENVIKPVIDYIEKEVPGADSDRIGALGISFGAFLLPRACAFDKRIKVCITDPGNIAWGTHFADIFTKALKMPKMVRPATLDNLMADYAYKHGVDMEHVIPELRKYDNSAVLDQITCKVLVLDGSAEITPGQSKKFYDALKNCDKEFHQFDIASTAEHHSQMGGYQVGAEYVCDWIQTNL
jgi:dipeptidyl aminopeptidase/acylaminoacyl peptidase